MITSTINSNSKIAIKNPTGFPKLIPMMSFMVPSKKTSDKQ